MLFSMISMQVSFNSLLASLEMFIVPNSNLNLHLALPKTTAASSTSLIVTSPKWAKEWQYLKTRYLFLAEATLIFIATSDAILHFSWWLFVRIL